ncbi:amino acid aldolase or racemase-like protein [Thozetella sp. PMI_491]|nr:amino acid aldolase or racemase-like protein [Thozetella sp. PMI_491]
MGAQSQTDGDAYYRQLKQVVAGRASPQMLVDLDRLESNAHAMLTRAGRMPIRLGTKSIRCTDILRRVFALSPQFQGLLCYSAREAAWLAREGFDDLLVAYPTVDVVDLAAAADAIRDGKRLTLMVDSVEQCERIVAQARAHSVRYRVAMDVDMSTSLPGLWFGVRRSPVRDVPAARQLAQQIAAAPDALQLVGMMGYEAQIAGLQDHVPGGGIRNVLIRLLKRRSLREVQGRRQSVVAALHADGHNLEFVNGGGTGSLEATAADASVTETTAGSGLYAPGLFDHFSHFRHQACAFFSLPVVRRPAPGLVACAGGGYIASGPAGRDRLPRPFLPAGMQMLSHEGAGEVQTPLRLPVGFQPALGDPLFFRHAKGGELAEHFDHVLLFRGTQIVGIVPTYRGQQQNFF